MSGSSATTHVLSRRSETPQGVGVGSEGHHIQEVLSVPARCALKRSGRAIRAFGAATRAKCEDLREIHSGGQFGLEAESRIWSNSASDAETWSAGFQHGAASQSGVGRAVPEASVPTGET